MQTPGEVAAQLAVSAQTLRRWSTAFAGALSASASPEAGRKRFYTQADVDALRVAKSMLAEGHTIDETAAALATRPQEAHAIAVIPPASDAERLISAAVTAAFAQGHDFAALAARVDALTKRVDAFERAGLFARIFRRRD